MNISIFPVLKLCFKYLLEIYYWTHKYNEMYEIVLIQFATIFLKSFIRFPDEWPKRHKKVLSLFCLRSDRSYVSVSYND